MVISVRHTSKTNESRDVRVQILYRSLQHESLLQLLMEYFFPMAIKTLEASSIDTFSGDLEAYYAGPTQI